jgi:sugar phosphate isomerase/epimerase
MDVRYHFPLGRYEIADPDHAHAFRAFEHVVAAISAIAEEGGSVLTVHAPLPSEARGTDQFWATAARLREAVRFGLGHGVSVCLENLRWGATSDPAIFVELLDASGAAATFDVGHANSSAAAGSGFTAERFARVLAGRITGAHVYERETDVHHAPATLDGIAPTLEALLDWGCDWWTIELTRPGDVIHTARLLNDYLGARPELAD